MDPEYISKTGYDARAGAELTRNSIQMTGNLRMDTVRPFRWTSFENMKRAQEVTAINVPAQYNRPGDSLRMIPSLLQFAGNLAYRCPRWFEVIRCFEIAIPDMAVELFLHHF